MIKNKKAYHDYTILDRLEVGISLVGQEIKSIRKGAVNLKDSFIKIINHEFILSNMHISPWQTHGFALNDPLRDRKLLAHKQEIKKWERDIKTKSYTIVPLSLYFKNGKAKLEIALVKGKKNYDKRQALKEKDIKRDVDRQLSKTQ